MGEHLFATVKRVTAQGSPLSVLRRAIRAGSLGAIDMALFEVPRIDLQDALEILVLMAKAGDPRFDAWAERWAERAAATDRQRLTTLIDELPDEDALRTLRDHAELLRQAQSLEGVPGSPGDSGSY